MKRSSLFAMPDDVLVDDQDALWVVENALEGSKSGGAGKTWRDPRAGRGVFREPKKYPKEKTPKGISWFFFIFPWFRDLF